MKVVARELGTNIRRLQVFGPPPNTHAMSGLRKRRNNGKDHVTSNTMKHAAAVLTMEVDPILPMNNEHTDISVDKIPTAIEVSVEDIAVNVNTDVATEMEDVLSPMDTSKHQESILPSTSTDDPDVVGSVVDDESFDHDVDVGVSSGKTEGPNKKDILPLMLNPNEQVFIGSKLYHSKFIFWQVKSREHVIFILYSTMHVLLCVRYYYDVLYSSWVGTVLAPMRKWNILMCLDVCCYPLHETALVTAWRILRQV